MTPNLNRLTEKVQMRGHNICFLYRINKNYPYFSQVLSYLELSTKSIHCKNTSEYQNNTIINNKASIAKQAVKQFMAYYSAPE